MHTRRSLKKIKDKKRRMIWNKEEFINLCRITPFMGLGKNPKKIIKSVSLTFFVFGLLGWVYIVLVALVHPETLTVQLTHLTPWIREDTYGILSFIVAFTSFFIWNLVKDN